MSILQQINQLSDERQALWRQKWSKRTMPEYRERLQSLDRRISALWHEHRCEVAAPGALAPAPRETDHEVMSDFAQLHGIHKSPSRYQVRDGDRWRNVSDEELAEGISRYTADVPKDDGIEIIPLSDLLKRRGKTLEFRDGRMGQVYSTEVKLPI